jgi:hypothetical protein
MFCSLLLCIALASCGGGGSETPSQQVTTPPAGPSAAGVASAEGLWKGNSSVIFTEPRLLILEDGQVWNVYGGGNAIAGLLHGTTLWNGSSITSHVDDFDARARATSGSSLTGIYTPKGTLTATTVHRGASVSLSTTYQAVYEQPANIADLQGYWQVTTWSMGGNTSANVNVNSAGAFTSVGLYCTGSGTVRPRASGKNVFDLTVNFTGASCEFNGKRLTGIAFVENLFSGSNAKQLIVSGLQPDKLNGFVGYGIR